MENSFRSELVAGNANSWLDFADMANWNYSVARNWVQLQKNGGYSGLLAVIEHVRCISSRPDVREGTRGASVVTYFL